MSPENYSEYEWSDSGLRLLANIKAEITLLGGNDRTADVLDREWLKSYRFHQVPKGPVHRLRKWDVAEIEIICKNRHITSIELSDLLPGRTINSIQQKSYRLLGLGKFARKRRKLASG